MINEYITILTFIPWIILFIIVSLTNLNNDNYQKFSLKYLKKNFFKIFRIDLLFLIIVFYYFASFNKDFVDKYLFTAMLIYLCVNSFYEKKSKLKKSFFKKNILRLVLLFIVMMIPFIIYFINKNLVLTYKIMLLYLFFNSVIIILINYVNKLKK